MQVETHYYYSITSSPFIQPRRFSNSVQNSVYRIPLPCYFPTNKPRRLMGDPYGDGVVIVIVAVATL